MRNIILAGAFAAIAWVGGLAAPAHAAVVPCEDMLRDLRAAIAEAKLSGADAQKVAELESKGVERCNADDDKRADDFFAEALKIMGK